MIIKVEDPDLKPTRAYHNDAGLDLRAAEGIALHPGISTLVGTGVKVWLDPKTVGMVCPRSGLASKYGITVLNSPGIVDQGYHGEILVNLYNSSPTEYTIVRGDRIAQLVVLPIQIPSIEYVGRDIFVCERWLEGDGPRREANGHGSSGK